MSTRHNATPHMSEVRTALVDEIVREAARGEMKNGLGYASLHEGLAVLWEEFEELKAEVFRRPEHRSLPRLRAEAVQVAAVALRLAEESINPKHRTR